MADSIRPSARRSGVSRVFLCLLGLSIAGIGALFCHLMAQSFLRVLAVEKWPVVPCMIVQSEVVEFKPVPNVAPRYRLEVDYYYQWDGQTLHSGNVRSRVRTTTDRRKALGWQEKFPVGTETVCRVDPANPSFAVLEPESRAVGYALWFPALFVIGGLGIAIQSLRRGESPRRADGVEQAAA